VRTVEGQPNCSRPGGELIGKLSRDEVEQLLHTQSIGRLGCNCEGLTYVLPVTYAYDGSRIIVHSAEGMKLQMMRANPKVCFQVDHIEDMANWRSVIIWGDFRELHELEAAQAMGLLIERLSPSRASATAIGSPTKEVVYEIVIAERTGRFEKS
jgi:nitroimidazol reductase NimA-like FMN-containing flavoprotein (pyridoxamine 5'-phosphate oxidase superfamily)